MKTYLQTPEGLRRREKDPVIVHKSRAQYRSKDQKGWSRRQYDNNARNETDNLPYDHCEDVAEVPIDRVHIGCESVHQSSYGRDVVEAESRMCNLADCFLENGFRRLISSSEHHEIGPPV